MLQSRPKETPMTTDYPNGMIMDLPVWDIHCEHCWQSYPLPDKKNLAFKYFNGTLLLKCADCKQFIDWWASTLKSIKKVETSSIHEICLPIGARTTTALIPLLPNKLLEIDFKDCRIPEDAFILNVNYNTNNRGDRSEGMGWLESVEVNRNPLFRRLNTKGGTFYALPHGDPPYVDSNIHISITWAPNTANDESSQNLINAFLYYIDSRFHGAVIAANAAVEAKMTRLMADFFNRTVHSKDKVKGFLKDGATYGHSLNVLLPALLSFTKAPSLPDHIRGALNRVRDLRNDLAHANITYDKVNTNDAAQALCAAVFGLHYLNVIEPFLFKKLRKKEKKLEKLKTPTGEK
jgi:hypothetical protein